MPLVWYPRLWHATPEERKQFELLAHGEIIHWPLIDEDLSVEDLLVGRRSGESPGSFFQMASVSIRPGKLGPKDGTRDFNRKRVKTFYARLPNKTEFLGQSASIMFIPPQKQIQLPH